jgi:hypothetical protein
MNKQFDDLMYSAGLTAQGCWDDMDEYDRTAILTFAELIVKQCVGMCGSQADKKNISLYFGLPTEPDVKYPAAEESWSVKSQYSREYNYPK